MQNFFQINGGAVPVGYKVLPDKPGYLEIDPPMANIIREAFNAYLREGCLSHAAKWLNDQGYVLRKQKEGGGRFKRVGHFTVDNLQGILRLKAYIGIKAFTHKDEVKEVKAVWPAIVDELTFARANKLLDSNKSRLKPYKVGKFPYLLSGLMFCKCCGSHMPGKSATGNGGKIGYYEHSWATKRDSTLSKKIFRCEPHRVPAKVLEPLIWQNVSSFVTDPKFAKHVLERVQHHHQENPHRKDRERLKAKISGINSQIDALAERLSELPKNVPAQPIYKQMAKLQEILVDYQEELLKLENGGPNTRDKIVQLNTFENFAFHYRHLVNKEADFVQRKDLVKKFVKKVEVGTDAVKIHFIVDQGHYSQELGLKRSIPDQIGQESFFKISGSHTLTFGAPKRT